MVKAVAKSEPPAAEPLIDHDPPPMHAREVPKAPSAPTVAPVTAPLAPLVSPVAKTEGAGNARAAIAGGVRQGSPPHGVGRSSLTRALGLKITRVVIDPATAGTIRARRVPTDCAEKELVLDVAQRLGKLIEERMGSEVIYTRRDDTFIPLEGRTAIANEKKADLFLSIHANSSPYPRDSPEWRHIT